MTLAAGDSLAHYRITAKLGEGGMGEVYRATDTRLSRQVAVKVLPEKFFEDEERRLRFEREARTLASLNHPGIAAIHSFEETPGPPARHLLVMELVEGQDLAHRMSSGPLPLEECLSLAREIAEALEAAHEKGIVHRDLKPANVKVTPEGRLKLLDFGLAKALDPAGASSGVQSPSQLAASPTLTLGATVQGVILGTAAYMSPEQAKGMAVDKRSDIWAFGVVLFEMLSGTRLFDAPTVPEILAQVLTRTPDLEALPPSTPPAIRQLLRRCLERNPKNRLHDIADARIVLDEVLSGPPGDAAAAPRGVAAPPRTPTWRRALPWALLALAGAGWALSRFPAGEKSGAALRTVLPLDLGEERLAVSTGAAVVLSPDGRRVAWVGGPKGASRIVVRELDTGAVRRLEGTAGAHDLAFSPDGREVAFFGSTSLLKVPVGGGAPQRLADVGEARGLTFTDDGFVVYNTDVSAGLWRVPATGGTPERLTAPDEKKGERSHRWPFFVRGTHRVLFLAQSLGQPYDEGTIEMLDLATGTRAVVHRGGSYPRVARGKLLYVHDKAVWAAAFDAKAGRLTGPPVRVLEAVAYSALNGGAQFDVADDGTLVYAAGGGSEETVQLSWYDPKSDAFQNAGAPGPYYTPALGPDDRSLAVQLFQGGRSDLWILDLATGSRRRLTFGGRERNPVWSPDGTSIAYCFVGEGSGYRLARVRADGVGDPVPFASGPNMRLPTSWSKSGALLITELSPRTHADIWVAWPGEPTREPQPLVQTPANESEAVFSPDGRWVAYQSDDSGTNEIYARAFAGPGGRWQLSEGGGTKPLWAPDGRAVYYWSRKGLCRREVEPKGEALRLGRLSASATAKADTLDEGAVVARDGRVLVRRPVGEQTDRRTVLILGWGRELDRLVAAR